MRTSFLQKFPLHDHYFRALAPLFPRAFESFDLSAFDTIVSSTTAWAKGVRAAPGAKHVCYINTVSRFAFSSDLYLGGFRMRHIARPFMRKLVAWDQRAAQRPTAYIANSQNVANRVKQFYGRDAFVLHCPVDLDRFTAGGAQGEHFIVISRLLSYKRIELAIAACALAKVPLYVVGDGPARRQLQRLARGTTTTLLGFVPDRDLNPLLAGAKAAILPGEEDFGLVPLEAAACGRPTIAWRGGGALETVVEGTTGLFFNEPSPQSLAGAIERLSSHRFEPQTLRAHAERYGTRQFKERLREIVDGVCAPGFRAAV